MRPLRTSSSATKKERWIILKNRWPAGFRRNRCAICPILIACATTLDSGSCSPSAKQVQEGAFNESPSPTLSTNFVSVACSTCRCDLPVNDAVLLQRKPRGQRSLYRVQLSRPHDHGRSDLVHRCGQRYSRCVRRLSRPLEGP